MRSGYPATNQRTYFLPGACENFLPAWLRATLAECDWQFHFLRAARRGEFQMQVRANQEFVSSRAYRLLLEWRRRRARPNRSLRAAARFLRQFPVRALRSIAAAADAR